MHVTFLHLSHITGSPNNVFVLIDTEGMYVEVSNKNNWNFNLREVSIFLKSNKVGSISIATERAWNNKRKTKLWRSANFKKFKVEFLPRILGNQDFVYNHQCISNNRYSRIDCPRVCLGLPRQLRIPCLRVLPDMNQRKQQWANYKSIYIQKGCQSQRRYAISHSNTEKVLWSVWKNLQ